ncbi:tyrosine-type recombinase/integrase [Pseudoduganella umbonata]|uniref:DUF4102 domain-containing protein n=1 Tax=Pseudoduganella umbonata TaxID=864828 RepID=A0A4P8HLK7_9BURK|nr:site-specific integrase [Pseudoduganella umbonata]MBB3221725.1 integrase [Pseudoduganella umbonata]QCP09055.1 DUF4102 domain-containing protein [Pseudoduganella umbonata]
MVARFKKLSALVVRNVDKPGHYGDGGGLWLQVSRSGSKSWVFRYDRAGSRHEMGLGAVHTVDLATARVQAQACRLQLQNGVDPLVERQQARAARMREIARQLSFDECAAAYIAAHRPGWENAKHAAQWESTLARYASPHIGDLPVAAVDTHLIVELLSPIWATKTETATRLRGRIESILDWATVKQYRDGDNPARWRGHLDNLLAMPTKIAPVRNHPALPWRDIAAFVADLRQREGNAARAVEFAILTACRSGEVRGATWSEIDLGANLWIVPAERMKARKEHRVPLSTGAMNLLAPMSQGSGHIFTGRDAGVPLSDMSLTAVLRRMGRHDITVHGFRSTFRDWCAEAAGNMFSREVCEHALAHSLPDKVEAAYRRGDLLEKRVLLMQAWSSFCLTKSA